MKNNAVLSAIILVIVLFVLSLSMYIVTEGNNALTLRLGALVMESKDIPKIERPGLHFKIPFITEVKRFDVRLQTLKVDQSRIYTAEQKSVLVDYYVKWRIDDLALFYKRTSGMSVRAQTLLSQKVNNSLRAAFGKRTITEVVSDDRLSVMGLLKQKADESAEGLGIKVIDVRIQGIELPREVRESVYQRMSTEREQVAMKHRAQGKAQAEATKAQADAEVIVQVATAKTKAQKLRADGDKKAAEIYLTAYSKNTKLFSLYKSLESYKKVFAGNDTMMLLQPDSDFFKYFKKSTEKTT